MMTTLWLMAEAYPLRFGGYLLLCVVGTAHQRTRFDVGKSNGEAFSLQDANWLDETGKVLTRPFRGHLG